MVACPRGACQVNGIAWEDPKSGEKGLGLAQLGVEPSNALYRSITKKPGSIRECKTAYMAKPYGTLSEYES